MNTTASQPDVETLLRVENLQAYYGKSHVLHGVDLTVGRGEIVSLLGRNGVGRSTTAKAIISAIAKRPGYHRRRCFPEPFDPRC